MTRIGAHVEDVVLLPAWHGWKGVEMQLAPKARTWLPEATDTVALASYLDFYELRRITLAASREMALVATRFAVQQPGRVSSLVVSDLGELGIEVTGQLPWISADTALLVDSRDEQGIRYAEAAAEYIPTSFVHPARDLDTPDGFLAELRPRIG